MIKGKRILITGGSGFIGSALAERLAPENDVTLLDLSFGKDTDCLDIARAVGDITDTGFPLRNWVGASQIIIHTAAHLGVRKVLDDVVTTIQTNVIGTTNLLRSALLGQNCERFISLSTSEVFGTNALRVPENGTPIFPSVLDPRWCYGVGKLAAEQLALGYHRQYGLPVTVIRPFNVFGEGRKGTHALLQFAVRALRGKNLILYGTGTQVRAWCHIDDFCDAVLLCLESEKAIGQPFNIGNPDNFVTMHQLADWVIRLCDSDSGVVFCPPDFMDIQARVPDISRAREVLGFEPRISLDDGLRRTIEWVRENIDHFDQNDEYK